MRPYFLLALLFFSIPGLTQLQIFFDPGKTVVPDTSKQHLLHWANEIKSTGNPVNIFILKGYTDNTGNNKANKALGMKRTLAVKSILLKAGFDEKNFSVESFGEEEPIGDNSLESGRQLNRRVDVLALTPPVIREENDEDEDSSDINDLFLQLKDPGQGFCIKPDRDTALVGVYGTIIYYTANTFKSSQECSCIRIVLHEYFKKSDLVLNNLTTTSDGLPLISGGMIKLEGYCGDSLLSFDPGKYLTVMVPTDTVDERMKLLTANREKQSDILNWKLDPDFPELDFLNWDAMLLYCSTKNQPDTVKCPFFFCKIRNFFRRLFAGNGIEKTELQKNYEKEANLVEKYAFKEKMLGDALLKSKKNNGDVLNYYVYKNASWDYKNIDMFANGEQIDFTIIEVPHKSKDFKLIAKSRKTILPAYPLGDDYTVQKIYGKIPVWVVGLKYSKGKSYLALKEDNTTNRSTSVNFDQVTIEELKTLLQKLDSK